MGDTKKHSDDKSLLDTLKEIDEMISNSLSLASSKDSEWGHLRPHMKGLEYSCHGLFWISGCIICLWFTSDPSRKGFFFNLLLALVLDLLMVAIMKASIRRKRPSANSDDMFLTVSIDRLSCPSGHTSRAVLMCLILISSSPGLYILHPLLIIWSVSTCASRIILGRHFLGDVLVGALLGYIEYKVMSFLWLDTNTAIWYLNILGESDGAAAIVDDL